MAPVDALHRRIARRIREIAKERGILVSHVPDRAGVARGHFWHVLRGDASPTVEWLEKIARVLDVEVEELLVRRRARSP